MATPTKKKRRPPPQSTPAPPATTSIPLHRQRWLPWTVLVVAVISIGITAVIVQRNANKPPAAPAQGLPHTPDYHSLMVSPANPQQILLGTHLGIYGSSDGGRVWHFQSLAGKDAMNLARPGGSTVWMAGHGVMARSTDGGKSWTRVLNAQLIGLAINPNDPKRVLATGPGILLSTDGGKTWRQALKLDQGAGPVAWAPSDPKLAYVVGLDRTFYRSTDGGLTWQPVGGR